MKLQNTTSNQKQELRMRVMSCMETGNIGSARTYLEELNAIDAQYARELTLDVVAAYGTKL